MNGVDCFFDGFSTADRTTSRFSYRSSQIKLIVKRKGRAALLQTQDASGPNSGGFREVFDTIVTGVGASVLSGDLSLEAAEATKEAAMASELEFSGVSLDTEAAQLLEQQQAFQASARILATAKQLFQTLLDVV